MTDHDAAHEVRSDVGFAGTVAGVESLGFGYVEGASVTAGAAVAGGLEGASTTAAVGAGGLIAAGAVSSFALGYEAGSILEEHTHIGSHLGDAIHDAEHPTPVDSGLDGVDAITVVNTDPDLDAIDYVTYANE